MHYQKPTAAIQILLLAGYILSGLILSFLGLAIYLFVTTGDINQITNLDTTNVNFVRLSLFFNHLGLFVLPGLFFAIYPKSTLINGFLYGKGFHLSGGLLAASVAILAIPFVSYLGYLNMQMELPSSLIDIENWLKAMETQAQEVTLMLLMPDTFNDLLINLFLMALIPALGEEFVFRGILQPNLIKLTKNKWVGLVLTSVIFSAMHMQFYGFLPRFFIGFVLGYMVMKSGKLFYGFIGHFANNAILVLLVFGVGRYTDINKAEFLKSTESEEVSILLWLPALLLMIFLLYKAFNQKLNKTYGLNQNNL
jgi:membrane protease YdiL (CAAX protease family)